MAEKLTKARVLYNFKAVEPPSEVRRVGEILAWVEREVAQGDEVLVRAVLNGEDIEVDGTGRAAVRELGEDDLLECYGRSTLELVREAFGFAEHILPAVIADLEEASLNLRGKDQGRGLDLMMDCIDALEWFFTVCARTSEIYSRREPERLMKDSGRGELFAVFSRLDRSIEVLGEIEQAQRQADLVMAADLIEYELVPLLKEFAGEVPSVRERFHAETARA